MEEPRRPPTYPIASVDRALRYVDAVESARALRVASRTGRSLPAHCTAAGKALLAELSPRQVSALLAGGELEAATDRSIAVRGGAGRAVAALSVAGPVGRMGAARRDLLAADLRAAAGRLREALRP